MSLKKLAAELRAGHPDTGPYSANAETAASEINAVNRSRNIDSLSGDVVFQTTDATEFAGLTDSAKALWLSFCGRDQIDPFRSANVAFVRAIFGNQIAAAQSAPKEIIRENGRVVGTRSTYDGPADGIAAPVVEALTRERRIDGDMVN